MGIHYSYKSQRGERAAKKQAKQMERERRSRNRKLLNKKPESDIPVNIPITLDMLTDPNKK